LKIYFVFLETHRGELAACSENGFRSSIAEMDRRHE
jgi:hypothetical protein